MAKVNVETKRFSYKGFEIIVNYVQPDRCRVRIPELHSDSGWMNYDSPKAVLLSVKDLIDLNRK